MPADPMTHPGSDGWDADIHPFPAGWPAPTRRMSEQRWLVDAVIRQVGVDWDQGRTRYIGNAGGVDAEIDFGQARERITKLADVERVFATLGARRERLAEAAIAAGHDVTARKHAFIASLLWGAAEWTFFASPEQVRRAEVANQHKRRCHDLWMERAPHPVRRIRVPYGRGSLSGILHLPPNADGPVPCVLHVGGMDSFKEHAVLMSGDRYLDRGIARFLVDLPGQGEAVLDGAFIGRTNMVEAGLASLEVLRQQPDIDASRLGLTGVSFGSWWATQIAAHAPDLAGTAVWAVVHEAGLEHIFEQVSPTFKARFMAMAGYVDEDAFDAFARRWRLDDEATRVTHPYLVLAGEDDELSPIEHTYRLLDRVPGPRELVVYRGERHSIGGGPAARLGPNAMDLAADWFADRFAGRPTEERVTVVDVTGQTATEPLEPWLASAIARMDPALDDLHVGANSAQEPTRG
ncbi:MAG: alpha/beta hydrolase [Chloroflexi bacterium]|nr:alpha/beta hydrolase [Chloroflexota bacterium]